MTTDGNRWHQNLGNDHAAHLLMLMLCEVCVKHVDTLMQQMQGVVGQDRFWGAPKCSSLILAFRSSTRGTKHCLPTPAAMISHGHGEE